MGIVVTDESIKGYLRSYSSGKVDDSEFGNLLQSVSQGRISQRQFFDAMRNELLALRFLELFYRGIDPLPPAVAWDYFQRLNRQVSVEAAAFPVADYLSQVEEPTDAEIAQLYDEGKDRYPMPNSPEPGFKQRKKIALEYVKADLQTFLDEEKPKITDEEVAKYYEANQQEFRTLGGATSSPPSSGPSSPSLEDVDLPFEQQPDETAAPGAEPADGGASTENPTPGGAPASAEDAPAADDQAASAEENTVTEPEPAGAEQEAPQPLQDDDPSAEGRPVNEAPAEEPQPPAAGEQPVTETGSAAEEAAEPAVADESPADEQAEQAEPAEKTEVPPAEEPAAQSARAATKWGADALVPRSLPSVARFLAERTTLLALAMQETPTDEPAAETSGASEETDAAEATPSDAEAAPSDAEATPPDTEAAPSDAEVTPPDTEAKTEPAGAEGTSAPDAEMELGPLPEQAGGNVPEARPEFRPLEEVADEIRTRLARPLARERMDVAINAVRSRMGAYYRKYVAWSWSPEDDRQPQPTPLDLQALAAEHNLTAGKIPLVDILQLQESDPVTGEPRYEISRAFDTSFTPFPQLIFGGKDLPTYKESTIRGAVLDTEFVFWETDEVAERAPTLDECRAEVVRAIKMRKALQLAMAAARKEAEQARSTGLALGAAFRDDPNRKVIETAPFSWMTAANVPGLPPTVSRVPGIQYPGPEFMQEVFRLKVGEMGVTTDRPQQTVYIVAVKSENTDQEKLRTAFLRTGIGNEVRQLSQLENQELLTQWYENFEKQLGIKWEREPRPDSRLQ
jgi:hypothetical protein